MRIDVQTEAVSQDKISKVVHVSRNTHEALVSAIQVANILYSGWWKNGSVVSFFIFHAYVQYPEVQVLAKLSFMFIFHYSYSTQDALQKHSRIKIKDFHRKNNLSATKIKLQFCHVSQVES